MSMLFKMVEKTVVLMCRADSEVLFLMCRSNNQCITPFRSFNKDYLSTHTSFQAREASLFPEKPIGPAPWAHPLGTMTRRCDGILMIKLHCIIVVLNVIINKNFDGSVNNFIAFLLIA